MQQQKLQYNAILNILLVILLLIGAGITISAQTLSPSTIYEIQQRLKDLGYDPGPIDGKWGNKTQTAIIAYQKAEGLPVTGQPEEELLIHLIGVDSSNTPIPFVQAGYSLYGISSGMSFSPDGRFILAGSKLWEVKTGREVHTFQGYSAIFSPDGQYVLSEDGENLKLWNVTTGKEIRTFWGHSTRVTSLAFGIDGRFALSGSKDGSLKLWEVGTGQEVHAFQGHSDEVTSVAFSPDGRFALSGSKDGSLKLWEVGTGEKVHIFQGHSDGIKCIAFSPDGHLALSGGGAILKLWEIATGNELQTIQGYSDASLPTVKSVTFSPDGRFILSGGDRGVKLWQADTGKAVLSYDGAFDEASFSPDGRSIASSCQSRPGIPALCLWETATGKKLREFGGKADAVTEVAFSPDGDFALFGGVHGMLRLWDMRDGKVIRTFKGHSKDIISLAFSPDSKSIISGGGDNVLRLWDIASGKELRTFEGHSNVVISVIFSPNGRLVLSGSWDDTIRLWNIETGQEIWKNSVGGGADDPYVAFLPDGKFALSGAGETVTLWDVVNGEEIRTFEEFDWTYNIVSLVCSSDGRFVLSGGYDGRLVLSEINTGEILRTFQGPKHIRSVALSSDDQFALLGGLFDGIRLWNIATGETVRTLTGHSYSGESVAFSPDDHLALSGSFDATVRLWNINTGKELVKIVSFIDDEWIAITPEGYYSASINGGKYLNVKIGTDVYGIEQYEEIYYRPDIVALALKLGDTQQAIAQALKGQQPVNMVEAQPPKVWFVSPQNGYETDTPEIQVIVKTEDLADPADSVIFKVNNRPLRTKSTGRRTRPVSPNTKVQEIAETIPLAIGENWIEVEARGMQGTWRTTMIRVVRTGTVKSLPTLYYLGVGVAQHSNPDLTLDYPVRDVTGLAKVLEIQRGRTFADVKMKLLTDHDATRGQIIDTAETFFQAAQLGDVAIFFVSGHGMNSASGGYHFVAYDTNPDRLSSSGVSWETFNDVLNTIDSNVLLLADTCHSGAITGNTTWQQQAQVTPDEFLREANRNGVFVFASSSGSSVSQENPEWGHGAFTKALIDGLSGEADVYNDGVITISLLREYVMRRVRELTENTQEPRIPQLSGAGELLDVILANVNEGGTQE